MPRTAEQFEAMREASREKILQAALELFAHHGYAGTSVRMLAREVGVSQGLIYNYFDGKKDVLRAIFERSMDDVMVSFAQAAEAKAPGERLDRLVRAAFDVVAQNRPFWRLTYQLRMQPGVLEDVADHVAESTEHIRGHIAEILEELGSRSPETHARVLFAAIDGAAQHYAMDPEGYPTAEVADGIIRRFVPGPDECHDTR